MARATMAQGHELQKLLSGYSDREIQRLLDSSHLLRPLVEADPTQVDWLRYQDALKPFDPNTVFTSPSDQIEMVRDRFRYRGPSLQRRKLDAAFKALPDNPGTGLECYTFSLWLTDFTITYKYLWHWFCDVHGLDSATDRWFDPRATTARMPNRRAFGNNHLGVVGLDLDAFWAPDEPNPYSPNHVRGPRYSPGLELLMAAILHPEWFKRAGESRLIPGVWVPGILLNTHAMTNPWSDVPLMRWKNGKPLLRRDNLHTVRPNYAIPTITTTVL
jgi:hypothetical protein